MASFYAYDFIFDDIPSQNFDLKIITFEDGGVFNGIGSANVSLITQKVQRKSKPYFLGRTQEPVLSFSLTFGTHKSLTGYERDIISQWLFGRTSYKKLYVLQDDLGGAFFNCFLTDPENLYIGNMQYAFRCKVTCDSPFAYLPERTVTITNSGSSIAEVEIYNNSTDEDYLYPTVIGRQNNLDSAQPSFWLTNLTDDADRQTLVTPVYGGEIITINSEYQIITSNYTSPPAIPLSRFNKNWFRLVPKINRLQVFVNGEISLIFTERVKIGG